MVKEFDTDSKALPPVVDSAVQNFMGSLKSTKFKRSGRGYAYTFEGFRGSKEDVKKSIQEVLKPYNLDTITTPLTDLVKEVSQYFASLKRTPEQKQIDTKEYEDWAKTKKELYSNVLSEAFIILMKEAYPNSTNIQIPPRISKFISDYAGYFTQGKAALGISSQSSRVCGKCSVDILEIGCFMPSEN